LVDSCVAGTLRGRLLPLILANIPLIASTGTLFQKKDLKISTRRRETDALEDP
jgi:hypothetical protein